MRFIAKPLIWLALVVTLVAADAQTIYDPGIVPPELVGGTWLNTPKGAPIKLADRKGKVTIVEFWTFG
ncbi:MAG: hypothetical protein HY248_02860 [Fimbriimonas ginsengisoli]|nr:hypothetical protein [Fimbriimonas ginsengisoli]